MKMNMKMNMNTLPGFMVVFFLLVSFLPLTADNETDILPLGPSKYKLEIDKVEAGQIIRTDTATALSLEQLIEQNKDTDVFIIGEAHDNYDCHAFQRDFIAALVKKYPQVIVGFEFFWRQDNEWLEQWRTGQISEADLIKKTGWYERGGLNYGYTALIMDVIRQYQIKTIGVNIPRDIVRTVSRQGFDQLTPEQKKLFPTIHIPNPEHEYFIKSVFGLMAVQIPMWFTNTYDAQKCWDVVMGESMREMLAKKEYQGFKGVIIAGNNHVAYKLGIPFRYAAANKKAKIVTISPILLPQEGKKSEDGEAEVHPMMKAMSANMNPAALYSRGIADYVFAAAQPLVQYYPVLGVSITQKDGKLVVSEVTKDSIAAKNGIRKGDILSALDGVDITTPEQFRTLIANKKWDDSVDIRVTKKIDLKKETVGEEKKESSKREKQE